MKLLWHAERLTEVDWLHNILGDVIDDEVTDLDCTCLDDNTIHILSSTWAPLSEYESYFQRCRENCKHIVLVHLSDEWLSGGYDLYKYFDLVIRWNHTSLASGAGIVTIPPGYPNDTGSSLRPVTERSYAWSFIGEIKASRIAMAAAFDDFAPKFMTGTDSLSKTQPKRLSKTEFDAVLADTVFAPCPMGNVILDTFRLYESLEFGCIPLVEVRPTLDYFVNLFGPHPIPSFGTWRNARRYAEALYQDKPALLSKQAEIRLWWQGHKADLGTNVRAALRGPSHAAELQRFAGKLRNRNALVHEPLRIAELLRHQTVDSLVRRLARPSGPLKRILADTSRGKVVEVEVLSRPAASRTSGFAGRSAS